MVDLQGQTGENRVYELGIAPPIVLHPPSRPTRSYRLACPFPLLAVLVSVDQTRTCQDVVPDTGPVSGHSAPSHVLAMFDICICWAFSPLLGHSLLAKVVCFRQMQGRPSLCFAQLFVIRSGNMVKKKGKVSNGRVKVKFFGLGLCVKAGHGRYLASTSTPHGNWGIFLGIRKALLLCFCPCSPLHPVVTGRMDY